MRTCESIELALSPRDIVRGDLRFTESVGSHAIVFVHGFGSNRSGEKALALEAACARRGWTFAAIDFRGHGESSGTMRELRASRLLEDLAALRDLLGRRGVKQFGLVGSSMGGFAAAWFALQHPDAVAGCVLIAPAFRFLQRRWDSLSDEERIRWWESGVLRFRNEWVDVEVGFGLVEEREQFPPERLEREWSKPLLIFHGLADDVVPLADSLAFIQNTPYPDVELRLFKAGDHRLNASKDEIAESACRFFEQRSIGTS
jgi:pimeloyl-ACP methyl ester carboxylesterase